MTRQASRAARWIADHPFESLRILSRIETKSPAAMHYLGSLLLDLPAASKKVTTFSDGEIENLLYGFLLMRKRTRQSAKTLLLEFCLREAVSPEELNQRGEFVAHVLQGKFADFMPQLGATLVYRDGGPLHYVYEACRRSWNTK